MSDNETLEQQAKQLAAGGDWTSPTAEQLNRSLVELNPMDEDALTRLGRIFCETGRLKEAREVYLRCLEANPENMIAGNALARLDQRFVKPQQREREQRFAPIQAFMRLVRAALNDPLDVEIPAPIPSQTDMELIERWIPYGTTSNRESEERRMLSARIAEKAVESFFRRRGHAVEDVSLTQLSTNSGQDWTLFDLRVGQLPVDVKNARKSERNPKRYVSHCVPRFKETRQLRSVQVAGVLSDWLTVEQMSVPGTNVVFLGLVDQERIERVSNAVNSGILQVSFRDGLRGPQFLPPWLFDYPLEDYECRDHALMALRDGEEPNFELANEAKLNPFAVYLAARLSYRSQLGNVLSEAQKTFHDLLLSRLGSLGLSLPVIFLSLLEYFLTTLVNPPKQEYSPRHYIPLLFPTEDRRRPLFVFDPLQTIDSLVQALDQLWRAQSGELSGFRMFRLHDLNILLGKKTSLDSRWTTLLAYCGGWIEGSVPRPCGTTPLVLGSCRSCECGKLICPNCDFCFESCAKRFQRKRHFNEGQKPPNNG